MVEHVHVGCAQGGPEVEDLLDATTLSLCELVGRHRENEVHSILRVVLSNLRDGAALLVVFLGQLLEQPFLVVLGPAADRQLRDFEACSTVMRPIMGDSFTLLCLK